MSMPVPKAKQVSGAKNDAIHRALQGRRKAKKAYQAAWQAASQSSSAPTRQPTSSDVLTSAESQLQSTKTALTEYLQSVVDLISIACEGPSISENTQNSQNHTSTSTTPPSSDICRELGILFQLTIFRPCRPIRQVLEKKTIDKTLRSRARKQLKLVIEVPFRKLFAIGDNIIKAFLKTIDDHDQQQHLRYRSALLRLLMYISDCHRYLYNNLHACNAAQFMRLISPEDPEAHMRLALSGAQLPNISLISHNHIVIDSKLSHFFHFSMFLINRNVPINHNEAIVVHKFIASCRSLILSNNTQTNANNQSQNQTPTSQFALLFIDVVWSCLVDSIAESTAKVRNDNLWSAFENTLKSAINHGNSQFIVAALMFASFQVFPVTPNKTVNNDNKGDSAKRNYNNDKHGENGEKSNSNIKRNSNDPNANRNIVDVEPQRDLIDELIARIILVLLKQSLKGLQTVMADARRRRKNRRRSLQKRRNSNTDTNNNNILPAREELISSDILQKAFDIESHVPFLGPLSFLCSFFSYQRKKHNVNSMVLSILSDILLLLRENIEAINSLMVITSTSKFADHVANKLVIASNTSTTNNFDITNNDSCPASLFPALSEDITFQHFNPCSQLPTLRNVVSHNIALASLLTAITNENKTTDKTEKGQYNEKKNKTSNSEILHQVLENMNKKTYEAVAGQTSKRHLEAFSLQRAKETPEWSTTADKESLSKVVALTIRRVRLLHLINDLERIHGGTLLHHAQKEKMNKNNDNKTNDTRNDEEKDHGNIKDGNNQSEIGKSKSIETKNEIKNRQPHSDQNSFLQEQITESDLEIRAKKRRRLQGGFSFGSGTPVIPKDSHESSDAQHQSNHSTPVQIQKTSTHQSVQTISPKTPIESNASTIKAITFQTPLSKATLRTPEHSTLHSVSAVRQRQFRNCTPEPNQNTEDEIQKLDNGEGISVTEYFVNLLNRVVERQDPLNNPLSKTLSETLKGAQPNLSPPTNGTSKMFWKGAPSDEPSARFF